MQNDDLGAVADAELQRRVEAGKARLELMDAQLDDIRDEGRQDTPVYERIHERRVRLDAEVQRLAVELDRRPLASE
ncbi:MAG: hypothetical protein ABR591_13755 [Candidatus Velthaea sp.]